MPASNFFKTVDIQNFKSIKSMQLDCGRINLFIGKPNVGKSTILEALALYCSPYSPENSLFLSDFIRYEKVSNLFFDQIVENDIHVSSNIGEINISFNQDKNNYDFYFTVQNDANVKNHEDKGSSMMVHSVSLTNDGVRNVHHRIPYNSPVRKYAFQKLDFSNKDINSPFFLRPPHGNNLLRIIETKPEIRKTTVKLFEENNLKILIDNQKSELIIFKEIDGIAYTIPFNLVADTLQRFIFHFAAVESNHDAIILFEEPESHSYPPYIRDLAQTIIDAATNQFFITTHSPYLFNTIVENCPPEELAVFITYMENYETKVKKLTDEELAELSNYGVDIFFNLNWFVHGEMDSATS
jgi:hypothetical protein